MMTKYRQHTVSTRRAERGFTLLEVIGAFAILALSLIGIYQVWYGSIARTDINAKQSLALGIARYQLENALADREFHAAQSNGAQNGMDWVITVEPFATTVTNSTFAWQPMKVRVDVSWPFRGTTDSTSLSTVALFHR